MDQIDAPAPDTAFPDPHTGADGPHAPVGGVVWESASAPVAYPDALARMEARVAAIRDGTAPELVWLVEHPPLYTAGTSADVAELVDPDRFPVFATGRGGRYTYHGPGQRVGYLMLDLAARGRDVRCYVHALEQLVIGTLATFGIDAFAVPDRIGIWTHGPRGEAKIGAIGVRVRRWVTLHGFSVNLDPALDHFAGIVPCGIADYPVTSARELGIPIATGAFDAALRETFPQFLGMLRCDTVAS